jgi:hypothetical protein
MQSADAEHQRDILSDDEGGSVTSKDSVNAGSGDDDDFGSGVGIDRDNGLSQPRDKNKSSTKREANVRYGTLLKSATRLSVLGAFEKRVHDTVGPVLRGFVAAMEGGTTRYAFNFAELHEVVDALRVVESRRTRAREGVGRMYACSSRLQRSIS